MFSIGISLFYPYGQIQIPFLILEDGNQTKVAPSEALMNGLSSSF